MAIDTSGNIGVGTTSPVAQLHVYSSSEAPSTGLAQITVDSPTNYPAFFVSQTKAGGNPNTDQGLVVDVAGVTTGTGNAVNVYGQGTSRFAVKNGGNVGIGTTNPQEMLDVDGNIRSSNLAGPGIAYACLDEDGVLFRSTDPCN